jgi:hypothetical protein
VHEESRKLDGALVSTVAGESALQMNDQLESAHVGGVDSRGRAERLQ